MASLLESEPGAISHAELREMARSIQQNARRQHALALKLVRHFQLQQFQVSGWNDPEAAVEAGAVLEDEALGIAEQAGRSADLRIKCAAAAVRINSFWLRAAVSELVENAFKFSPAGAFVTVTAVVVDGLYRIEVNDRGPGMSGEERTSIAAFRQFGRAKQEQQGLGLGLAIARSIAQLHQGALTLVPGPDGIGLHATLDLPLVE